METTATQHWAYALIGKPWSLEFDCWEFARQVFREHYAVELPEHAAGVMILAGAAHTTGLRPFEDDGQDGDLVLMRASSGKRHVGIMIRANGKLGVLHNDGHQTPTGPVGCVGFSTLRSLREQGCGAFQFWRRPSV